MSDKDLSEVWTQKLEQAEDVYKEWEKKFQVEALEEYEEGFQVAEETEAYVLNLFYATIEVKNPSLRFTKPIFHIKPSARSIIEAGDQVYEITQNIEDTINSFVLEEKNNFQQEILSAIDDSWSRFGIVEVGYEANWIDNPKISAPPAKSDYKPGVDKRRQRVERRQPELVPDEERIFVKNIPAKHFRISAVEANELWQCDWVGYYEYVRIEDLLSIPGLKNREDLQQLAERGNDDNEDPEIVRNMDIQAGEDIVKIWKVWDIRKQLKYCFCGNVLFWKKPYKIFPFVDLRFKRRKKIKGFYPLPVTFNWLSPQNEINEVRNAHRDHRRRFKRVYTANKNAFEDETQEEIQNTFINGPDGSIIFSNRDNPIQAVPNADLGSSAHLSMQVTLDDFNRISGTTSEMRGESDRTTATQAALSNERARVRESKEKTIVAEFIQAVGKKIISFHREMLVNPYAVTSGPSEGQLLDNYTNETIVRTIDPVIDLGDSSFDYSLMLQLSTISVVAAEEEKKALLEFLTYLNQFPQFSLSPTLIRELAYKTNYHNEKVLAEFQQLAQLAMIGLLQQAGAAIAGPGGNPNQQQQNRMAQMTPPTQEQIRNQLQGQGVPV